MKYAVIIVAGAADAPLDDLDGQTPLQVAATPTIDRLARSGRVGTACLTPPGLAPTADAALAVIFGVEHAVSGLGPGGVLAPGVGVELGPDDWGIVADLISVNGDGIIEGLGTASATPAEAEALFAAVRTHWAQARPDDWAACELHHAARGRAVMVDRTGADFGVVETAPPWEAIGEPWERHAPAAPGGRRHDRDRLVRLIESSYDALDGHEVNAARAELGQALLNAVWLWGPGVFPQMGDISVRTGLSTAVVGRDPILRGVARAVNAHVIVPAGDAEAEIGQAAVEAIDAHDLIFVHADAAAIAAATGDAHAKVDALRSIDAGIVGPIARALETFGDAESHADRAGWRIMVLPDRYCLTEHGRPDHTPVPFAMAGAWIRSVVPRALTEADANASDLHVDPGHELLEYFLRGGLARVRPVHG